ncbi:MAG: rhodanese-like domain-containing protein [Pseudobdellovibrio sp.]
MPNKDKILEFTCEQLHNIWLSEPDIIRIYDIRSQAEYEYSHIPGSIHLNRHQLISLLKKPEEMLAILVMNDDFLKNISSDLLILKNVAILKNCHRWELLGYPMTKKGNIGTSNYIKGARMNSEIIFYQLFEHESSTYTYIIADAKTKEAAIIDPVLETVDRDVKLINELELNLIYVLDTHIHADHITGAGEIRKRLKVKTAVSKNADVGCVDILLEDGQELLLGDKKIKVMETPGHTNTCLSFYFEGRVFTGDALLIRGCGRTDFQQGSADNLFQSVRDKLFKLPDDTIVCSAHDYRGQTLSTIALEKKYNPRLKETVTLSDFKKIMSELKLDNPKKIHEAVPANMACGHVKNEAVFKPQIVDGIPEISAESLYAHLQEVRNKNIKLIDVRRSDEFNNELAHIDGAILVPLGDDLTHFLNNLDREEEIIFICRSGARSATATAESLKLGFKRAVNLTGGMIRWNEQKLPTLRDNEKG